MPVEPDHTLPLAATDQYFEALHRHVEIQRLHPFDSDAQRIVAAQVVELGVVFALDRLDPKPLAPPVGLGPLSFRLRQRHEPRERGAAQVVVIGMDPVAVAFEAAAHGA